MNRRAMNTEHLRVRVGPTLKKRLKAGAKSGGVTLSNFTIQLLAWALARHEAEVARRARAAGFEYGQPFVGHIRGLPRLKP